MTQTDTQQRPGPPGTIRVQVRIVPVDVVVTDKNEKPILDLNKTDFAVLEDGVPQDVQHFSVETLQAGSPSPGPLPHLATTLKEDVTTQSARTFLILLGRGRHQRGFRCVDALIQFVRKDILPQDSVAIFAYNRATDFTTDHEAVAQVLERYKKVHEKIEQWCDRQFGGLAAIYGSKEIPTAWQSQVDTIFEGSEKLGYRRVPPGRVTEEAKIAQDERQVAESMMRDEGMSGLRDNRGYIVQGLAGGGSIGLTRTERAELKLFTDLPFDAYATTSAAANQDVQNIFTCINYLRYVEGEKHLIFLTENGLFLPRAQYDQDIASLASDARVAVDTFQTGGIYLSSSLYDASDTKVDSQGRPVGDPQTGSVSVYSPARSTSSGTSGFFALSSLRRISDLTGGRAAIHQEIGKALTRLNETTRVTYLLGYYPRQTAWDGKFRTITVKVNRHDTNVRYRHGYFARDILEPYDRQEFIAYSRIAATAAYGYELRDIAFKMQLVRQKDPGGNTELRVDLKIDASKVGFEAVNGLHSGKLQIAVFCVGPQDSRLGDDWQTVQMDLREETYQKALREGLAYSTSVPVRYNTEALKVVVYDCTSDKVGSLVQHLR